MAAPPRDGTDIPSPQFGGVPPGFAPGAGLPSAEPPSTDPTMAPDLPAPDDGFDFGAQTAPPTSLGDLAFEASAGAPATGLGGAVGRGGFGVPGLIGDMGPIFVRQQRAAQEGVPPLQPPEVGDFNVRDLPVSIRGIKLSENQSPIPQDRVFYSFNYYKDVNESINESLNIPFRDINVYRHVMGFEKTYLGGLGSFGLRVPIETVSAVGITPGAAALDGTSTAVGNMQLFLKHIVYLNDFGLISAGLQVSAPTGPASFANADFLARLNPTWIQPFVGYFFNQGRFYAHGFSSIDVPASDELPTFLYNDLGFGYLLYQAETPDQFLTLIAPTFEVHVNTPLTHRDPFNVEDPFGTPDMVNLTYGVNVGLADRALLSSAIITPVTGPRPFDFEVAVLLNIYFGGSNRLDNVPPYNRAPGLRYATAPPIIGN
ncbi:hypothetical protein [Tautonia marina]|uniref:hypothetical protein n=1 Tax=Tautonia marina TaxID=2653855 RepID=UPI001375C027|nr:hypothetical protein [Tautonia marina]